MNYRVLGRTGLKVSEIGMGCEGFLDQPYETVKAYIDRMEEAGVNCIDLYTPNPDFRSNLGRALRGRREKFVLQAHLCTIWKNGQYKRTRELSEVKEGFEDQLRRLETDDLDDPLCRFRKGLGDGKKRGCDKVCTGIEGTGNHRLHRHVQPQSGGGAGSGYERPGGCSDVQCQSLLRSASGQ